MSRVAILVPITFLFVLIPLIPLGSAQIGIGDTQDCPDKCVDSVLYLKGVWDAKLRQCVYAIEEPCKYGCEDDIKISKTPACKEFPDEPPTNVDEYDDTIWNMVRKVYTKNEVSVLVNVHGTEYSVGDPGKVFIQLLDSDRQAIDDSTCFLTSYYPNETKLFNDFVMSHVGDNGLYSYDLVIPDSLGVYMLSARCFIPQLDQNSSFAYDDFECNGFDCGTGWARNWTGTPTGTLAIETGGRAYEGIYGLGFGDAGDPTPTANRTVEIPINNETTQSIFIEFYAKKNNIGGDDIVTAYICDTSDVCFNIVTFDSATPSGWYHYSYTLSEPIADLSPGTITVLFNASGLDGAGDGLFLDNFNLTRIYDFNQSQYQEVKGAGEIHVTDYPQQNALETYLAFSTLPEPILLSNHDACLNDTHLQKTLTYELCISGNCDDIQREEIIPCDYGCSNNICVPPPWISIGIGLIVALIISVVLYWAWRRGT